MFNPQVDRISGTNIFISDQWGAANQNLLRLHGIKYILNVTPVTIPQYDFVIYKRVALQDNSDQNIHVHLPECFEFLDKAYQEHSNILVHCQAGISRSAAVVIAYLMYRFKITDDFLTYEEAHNFVKKSRPCIAPNPSFKQQLLVFESYLKTQQPTQVPESRSL